MSDYKDLIARISDESDLRDDAHRYRWLRDRLEFVDTKQIDYVLSAGVNGCLNQHIDAAIDAEMRAGSDGKEWT